MNAEIKLVILTLHRSVGFTQSDLGITLKQVLSCSLKCAPDSYTLPTLPTALPRLPLCHPVQQDCLLHSFVMLIR